jgi:hypothetical protein
VLLRGKRSWTVQPSPVSHRIRFHGGCLYDWNVRGDVRLRRSLPRPCSSPVRLTMRPQGEPQVSEPALLPVFEDFPAWLGGMSQEEAGLDVVSPSVCDKRPT